VDNFKDMVLLSSIDVDICTDYCFIVIIMLLSSTHWTYWK